MLQVNNEQDFVGDFQSNTKQHIVAKCQVFVEEIFTVQYNNQQSVRPMIQEPVPLLVRFVSKRHHTRGQVVTFYRISEISRGKFS